MADGELPTYRGVPSKGGKFPVIPVVSEIFGLHEYHSRPLPAAGQAGVFGDRHGVARAAGGCLGDDRCQEILTKAVPRVPDGQVLSDSDAAVLYPEAGHAFHAGYRPRFHQSSAVDGWRRLTQFLASRLSAS